MPDLPKHAAIAALETGFEVEIEEEGQTATISHPALAKPIPLGAVQLRQLADALMEANLLLRGAHHANVVPKPRRDVLAAPRNFLKGFLK